MYESQDATIYSQTAFSQREMPSYSRKRGRSMSRSSRSRSRSMGTGSRSSSHSTRTPVARTSNISKVWPYQRSGASQLWDPFPARATALLRYNETIELTNTAGLAAHYLFRANSIFDPNFTGTGHQPYGHDSYQAIYNHYKVNYATIVITPVYAADGMIGCTITDDNVVNASYDNVKEVKNTVMRAMGANGTPDKIVQYYNKNQVFEVNADGCGANFGANPTEQAFFDVWVTAKDTTTVDVFNLNISITYNVTFWELKDLGES